MSKGLAFLYGTLCYLIFLGTFLYAIGFVGNLVVPKSIDSGAPGPLMTAVVVNVVLMGLFAVQHSVMARPGFKTWWTRIVPEPVERSTYVLFASLLLILMFWQWRPMTGVIWEVANPIGANVLWAVFATGWLLVLLSTFVIDHFDLFGMRQVYFHAKGKPVPAVDFKVAWFYKYVRHPLLLGFMIGFWGIPRMTEGHLLFAAVTTVYMLIAIQFEERDLLKVHGEDYRDYRRKVPMICPWPSRK